MSIITVRANNNNNNNNDNETFRQYVILSGPQPSSHEIVIQSRVVSEYKRKAYRKVLAYFLAENM
jgi:hypothetical protein